MGPPPMKLADLALPLGVAPAWRDELWSSFVCFVLHVLVQSFEEMKANAAYRPQWRENQFSAALLISIWDIHDREPQLPFVPTDEARLLARAILDGSEEADRAPRIDLSIRHIGMPRPVYFGIEVKMLTDRSLGNRRPGVSVRNYVNKGMARFVKSRYSDNLADAAMIGFILSGNGPQLAAAIAACVESTNLPCSNNLSPAGVRAVCADHYLSIHPRRSPPCLAVHHLLLVL